MFVAVGNDVNCLDGVFHELQTVRMGLDCKFCYAALTGCQHSKDYNYPVVACRSLVDKTGHFVFEYAFLFYNLII